MTNNARSLHPKRGMVKRSAALTTRQTSRGASMSEPHATDNLCLVEGHLPVDETVRRLKSALEARSIPVFATFDHAQNADEVGLNLRPTTVVVFGAPQVGTALMQANQRVSIELPLRLSVWEDEAGRTWLAFPRMSALAARYDLGNLPAIPKMQALLESLAAEAAGSR